MIQDNSEVEPSAVQLVNQAGGTIAYAGGPVGASLAVPVTEDGTIQTSGDTLSLASSYTSAGTAPSRSLSRALMIMVGWPFLGLPAWQAR